MKNDDFWKSQFVKHDPTPGTGKPITIPAPPKPPSNPVSAGPKAVSTTELPSSTMEKMFQAVRATQATLSFDKFVSLILSKFPTKTKTQWEQWLLNQKAALVKKWKLSE